MLHAHRSVAPLVQGQAPELDRMVANLVSRFVAVIILASDVIAKRSPVNSPRNNADAAILVDFERIFGVTPVA